MASENLVEKIIKEKGVIEDENSINKEKFMQMEVDIAK